MKLLAELEGQLDLSRVHFTGKIPHAQLQALYSVSAAHVYLTYPFVLSWSMLEAMASGCLIIGSSTAPVQEVIRPGENGLLVDFFNADEIAETIIAALAKPNAYQGMRLQARRTVQSRYDLRSICLPQHLALVDAVASNRLPPRLPSLP